MYRKFGCKYCSLIHWLIYWLATINFCLQQVFLTGKNLQVIEVIMQPIDDNFTPTTRQNDTNVGNSMYPNLNEPPSSTFNAADTHMTPTKQINSSHINRFDKDDNDINDNIETNDGNRNESTNTNKIDSSHTFVGSLLDVATSTLKNTFGVVYNSFKSPAHKNNHRNGFGGQPRPQTAHQQQPNRHGM